MESRLDGVKLHSVAILPHESESHLDFLSGIVCHRERVVIPLVGEILVEKSHEVGIFPIIVEVFEERPFAITLADKDLESGGFEFVDERHSTPIDVHF